jgi:hypothetical protein
MTICVLANVQEKRLTHQQFGQLVGVGPPETAARTWSEASRRALVLDWVFLVEDLLKIVISSLGEQVPNTFRKVARKAVDLTGIVNPDRAFDALYTAARIRNTFHSEGHHNGVGCQVDVNGRTYSFVRGKKIHCFGWEDIIHLLNKGAAVIQEILDAPRVKAISRIARPQGADDNRPSTPSSRGRRTILGDRDSGG